MFSRPAWLLRLEELALLAAAVGLYRHLHFSWGLFAVLFLVPDVFMLGYLVNARLGSALYNAGHWLVGALVLGALGYARGSLLAEAVALIWFSHIVFDRAMGYGLKYPTAFKDTHLQRIG